MGRIAEALKKAQRDRISSVPQLPVLDDAGSHDSNFRFLRPGATTSFVQPPLFDPMGRIPARNLHRGPAKTFTWPADPQIVTLFHPSGHVAEQYRAARTWLLSHIKTGEKQCVALTGSKSGEGISVSTANLAVVMSEVSHMRVLIIDANVRKSRLSSLLQLPASPGLIDVLSESTKLQNAVVQTPRENLYFLPAGATCPVNPAELLNSRQATKVLDHLRDSFDYILVDTPAIQDCSDVGVIGALCSGIIVVVRMHQTPAPIVQQSIQWLQDNRLNVIGCLGAHLSPDVRG